MTTPHPSAALRRLFASCSLLLALLAVPAFAADASSKSFSIPSGDAAASLDKFSEQAGTQIVYLVDQVRGVTTNAVEGQMTPREALDKMVAGTALVASQDPSNGALVVKRASDPKAVGTAQGPTPGGRPESATAGPSTPGGADTMVLDPFEVKTTKDTSYGALNSNSLTHFNTELAKVPIAADILTHQFIEDTQARTVEDLFNEYAAGAGQIYQTETDINNSQPGDRFSEGQLSVRGLAAGVPRRDGFETGQMSTTNQNSTNIFDVERVDILHGPQGLLYGATGPGGVVNVISKQAAFGQINGSIEHRVDQYGSNSGQLDVNAGASWAALRFVAIDDSNQTRRRFIGDVTKGYYAQAAFQLPQIKSTLRLSAEETHNTRYIPITGTVSFAGTPFANTDPRNGYQLAYLFATNQLGAVNPATGQPFPGGAIDNGNLNRDNLYSLTGWHNMDYVDTSVWEANLDTNWTSWLSTSAGIYWNKQFEQRDPNGTSLVAPGGTGNTTGDWAVDPTYSDSVGPNRQRSYRFNALITKDLFDGRAKTQTSFGFDREYQDANSVVYKYYPANASGGLTVDPTQSNIYGNKALAGSSTFWSIGGGPLQYAGSKPGALFLNVGNQLYIRAPANPTNRAWVAPGNPLGLASIYQPSIGVKPGDTSENELPWTIQERDQGFYFANYSSFFDDRFETLLGFRDSDVFTRQPNTSNQGVGQPASVNPAWTETRSGSLPSYNAGLVYRVMPLPGSGFLRAYYGYSRTFNVSFIGSGNSDPYGTLVPNPVGWSHELGLKFNAFEDRLSGSASAFEAYTHNTAYNGGSGFLNTVNPTGISGNQFQGPPGSIGPGSFAIYDQISRGVELMLTAQPTPNWRVRLAVTYNDGTVRSNASYKLLYNDQFYTNSAGQVTYGSNSGPVVMVPSDAAGLALLAKQSSGVDMSKVSSTPYANSTLVPLTLSMINDPTSAYYAFGTTGTGFSGNPALPASGQPLNGSIATGASGATLYLKNALSNFTFGSQTPFTGAVGLPFSAMQYNFADPAGYGGTYVVRKAGEAVVGYPAIQVKVTNDYRFTQWWLKGIHVGGSVGLSWENRDYYYATPDRIRHLWSASLDNPMVNAWIGYSHKFDRVTWSTQINVNNMFNKYHLDFDPNNGTGFTNPKNIGVRWSAEPRYYVWSNTLSF